MMSTPSVEASDASFYEMVHYTRQQTRREPAIERRDEARHAYPGVHLMAPMIGGQTPALAEFQRIDCYDLSAGGFAFFSDRETNFATLAVALDAEHAVVYLSAEVIHCTPMGQDADGGYLVGCRFTGRLEGPREAAEG